MVLCDEAIRRRVPQCVVKVSDGANSNTNSAEELNALQQLSRTTRSNDANSFCIESTTEKARKN
jgi:hypothetical protein